MNKTLINNLLLNTWFAGKLLETENSRAVDPQQRSQLLGYLGIKEQGHD